MKILSDDWLKVRRENIYKTKIGYESWQLENNDSAMSLVDFATYKNLIANNTQSPHYNIHKYTLTSPDFIIERYISIGG